MKVSHTYKIFLLGFAGFALTGCLSEKKRAEICNTCPSESEDSIVVKTVTVPVIVPGAPGPTLYIENPCKLLCDSLGNLKKVNFTVNKGGQALNINTLGGGLLVSTATKDTTIAAQVPQKEVYSAKESIKYVPCNNERTAFDGFTRYWFYITAGLLALWGLVLYFRRFKPFLRR